MAQVNVAAMQNTPIKVISSYGVVPRDQFGAGPQNSARFHFRVTNTRVDHDMGAVNASGLAPVTFTVSGTGDSVYLPYLENKIVSTVLPASAASGIHFLFTDNLSGCTFHIDRVNASGDLIVYHSNGKVHTPDEATIRKNPHMGLPTYLPAAGQAHMKAIHKSAKAEYAAGGGVSGICKLEKPMYYAKVQGVIDREKRANRKNVTFNGGTNVVGFRIGGKWQFYFQTWGMILYEGARTVTSPLSKGPTVNVHNAVAQVIDSGRFY